MILFLYYSAVKSVFPIYDCVYHCWLVYVLGGFEEIGSWSGEKWCPETQVADNSIFLLSMFKVNSKKINAKVRNSTNSVRPVSESKVMLRKVQTSDLSSFARPDL